MSEIERVKEQLIRQFNPTQIVLFGSQAKGTAGEKSDIDLCIIASTTDKRRLLAELYYEVEADRPIDFILYTPEEWSANVKEIGSFAHKISMEGVYLYG